MTGPRLPGTPVANEEGRGRQNLRAMGFDEILRRCREMFPKYNRKEIRQLARKLHTAAWARRDHDAVKRFMER